MVFKNKTAPIIIGLFIVALLLHMVLIARFYANLSPVRQDNKETGCFAYATKTVGTMIVDLFPHQRCSGDPNNLGLYSCAKGPLDGVAGCQWSKPFFLVFILLLAVAALYWYSFAVICARIKAKRVWWKWTLSSVLAVLIFGALIWILTIFHVSFMYCSNACMRLG
ncbi:MAG: hypothetical protein PHD72_03605 [Patescibacteria group bacterium]|nr:hypothetical protein [Patescibacteria group bacterium]